MHKSNFHFVKFFSPSLSWAIVRKFDKSILLDAVPLLSFWAIITKIGASALLDALQIMKPPEGKSGPPSNIFPAFLSHYDTKNAKLKSTL